jgi:aerobic-type carbon monoxide dehydrogenase small subunit (CoxS/CutS family)
MSTNDSTVEIACTVNGSEHRLRRDPRESLLDVLRERLALTGTKKGCTVTTIEGVAGGRVQGGRHEH